MGNANKVGILNHDLKPFSDNNPLSVVPVINGSAVSLNNPSFSQLVDSSGRVCLNSVFGELITAKRIAVVSGQFKYGVPTYATNIEAIGSGSYGVSESLLVVSSGTDSNGYCSVSSKKTIRYIPGYDTFCMWTAVYDGTFDSNTGVTTGISNSFQRTGLFDNNDGFFVGFENEVFGITIRRLGVDTFYPIDLSSFKETNGYALDLTKGNIFRLNYGYLGFATIIVDVLTPSGGWVNLVKIKYPNSSSGTHITQTFLEPRVSVGNNGNSTNVSCKVGSFVAGIIDGGGVYPSTRKFSKSNLYSGLTGSTNVIAFRNKQLFNGFNNKVPMVLTWASVAADANKPLSIEVVVNPSELSSGDWTDVDATNSIVEFSTNTSWDSNGRLVLPFTVAKTGNVTIDIKDLGIEVYPGDVIVIRAITNSTGYDLTLGVKWEELF